MLGKTKQLIIKRSNIIKQGNQALLSSLLQTIASSYITYVRGNLRVFSRTRVHCKALLNGIGVDSFDPLQIVGKTKGRMAEDNRLNITRKARIALRSNALIFQTNL